MHCDCFYNSTHPSMEKILFMAVARKVAAQHGSVQHNGVFISRENWRSISHNKSQQGVMAMLSLWENKKDSSYLCYVLRY